MLKPRIFVCLVFLSVVLFPLQFAAQDTPATAKSPTERQAAILVLVRTINTIELNELYDYGSYAPWPILVAHHQEFNGWLKRFYSSVDPNALWRHA
jgi:hypothetical protein